MNMPLPALASDQAARDRATPDRILQRILDRIPLPVVPLRERASVRDNA